MKQSTVMSPNPIHTRDAVCRWLADLLTERLGPGLIVQPQAAEILLRASGSPLAISIPVAAHFYKAGVPDFETTSYRLDAEGFNTPANGALPSPGGTHGARFFERQENGDARLGFDVLGFMFWMLSRQEELERCDLDAHGRFTASASHALRFDYLERPIVDEWLFVLAQAVARVWPRFVLKIPRYTVIPSHDVDRPSLYGFKRWPTLARLMLSQARRGRWSELTNAIGVRLTTTSTIPTSDPFNRFDWLMRESESRGLSSTFNFICGRHHPGNDPDYEIEHPAILDLMTRAHARGHEIGLHPSYTTFDRPTRLEQEWRRLRTTCDTLDILQPRWGSRMHYLRWRHPNTLQACSDLGIDYDATMGYSDRPGFRCGTCHEYPAIHPVTHQSMPIRIQPLVAMECTVTDEPNLGLGFGETSLRRFEKLARACYSVGGSFTLLWHNSSLVTPKSRQLYSSVLDAACDAG